MKNRIDAIIRQTGLSPSRFADTLGVQRSGVSHILSGRNNPSLDFLMKVLEKFPSISGDWLITGEGDMLKKMTKDFPISQQLSFPSTESKAPIKEHISKSSNLESLSKPNDKEVDEQNTNQSDNTNPLNSSLIVPTSKTIDRIVVFYTDKTFTDYRPE